MSISTNLANRVKHTSLPKSSGLLPLFEAVVNSIHSIEEAGVPTESGIVTIEIIRSPQVKIAINHEGPGREPLDEIDGFKIKDNGVGFNEVNFDSFKTLDSEHKASKGCRGVGRILWLKAFDRVHIESDFVSSEEGLKRRIFDFTAHSGVTNSVLGSSPTGAQCGTVLHLDGFRSTYRDSSRKTAEAIAQLLFEHCLWYFIRPGGAPRIFVKDETLSISLDHIYENSLHEGAVPESITIKETPFELTHVKLITSTAQAHQLAFCAANRLVKEENLKGKIPGLHGRITDGAGDFVYACYISSTLLDENVRNERTGFDLEDDVSGMFAGSTVSWADIRTAVVERAKLQLEKYLEEGRQKGIERVRQFIEHDAPRYRPILNRIPEEDLMVDPGITNKELELTLHKHYAQVEQKLLVDGHDILNRIEFDNSDAYKADFEQYMATLGDIKMSDLANYVSHRKFIITLMEKALHRIDGKYAREDVLHQLIMPMRQESDGVLFEKMNLWLIDERLAFHNYLASDKPICSMSITESESTKEPDLFSLYIDRNPMLVSEDKVPPFSSLTVVEIKRPMRNDMREGDEKDPIEQALGYLQKVRAGGVTSRTGRPLGTPADIPGYCYIIADLTPTMISRCNMHDLTATPDGLGYFGYKKHFKAHVEVMGFDRLLLIAKQRNRAFFETLGLPT